MSSPAVREQLLEHALYAKGPVGVVALAGYLGLVAGIVLSIVAVTDGAPPLRLPAALLVLAGGAGVTVLGGLWAQRQFYAAATAAGLTREEAKALQDEADRLDDD